jgi:hypothetical protein
MRAELARPGLQIMSSEQFNQAFTMHGTIMLLMFATPLFNGFANWIMPLQIGAPDVAFPRLNMAANRLAGPRAADRVRGGLSPSQKTADRRLPGGGARRNDRSTDPGCGMEWRLTAVVPPSPYRAHPLVQFA